MKKTILILLWLCTWQMLPAQSFQTYFEAGRLRANLIFAGNADQQSVYLASLHEEPQWGGSTVNLVDAFLYGEYCFKIVAADGQVIYSRGFNSLFQEWRTTEEAKNLSRAYTTSLLFPKPKATVRLEVYERHKMSGDWQLLFQAPIHPAGKEVLKEAPNAFAVSQIINNGPPDKKVDVVFIAEGYRAEEMPKFRGDAARFASYLFDFEPFAARRADFNVWAVESISEESGPDIPHEGIWHNTVAHASFYTFGMDRYLTAPDHTRLCEIAWQVPYDAIYVIVNTNKYGGGGIYNFYALSMSNHRLEKEVFIHEFGHSFAGLGDEYYTSEVSYENFYNLQTEPWEPNLTTLVNFDAKWKDMVAHDTPIPTPNAVKYAQTVGVFEGGGYMTKGVFRPALDCRMKSNASPGFCPVCQRAISKMIDSYCQ
jgi:hypothetical protein